jgi:hypothetical protein
MNRRSMDPEAVGQFVAGVLWTARATAEAHDEPSAERTILHLARLFADELTAGDPGFDRMGFVTAATEGP